MAVNLPQPPRGVQIITATGSANKLFQQWLQAFVKESERQFSDLTAAQEQLEQTQADLAAAQASLEATQADLATAQTELAQAQTDIGTAADDIAALNAALPLYALKAGDVFTGPVDVQAEMRCDSLRIDAAPAVSADVVTHKQAVNLNGTTYYLLLSNV